MFVPHHSMTPITIARRRFLAIIQEAVAKCEGYDAFFRPNRGLLIRDPNGRLWRIQAAVEEIRRPPSKSKRNNHRKPFFRNDQGHCHKCNAPLKNGVCPHCSTEDDFDFD
jgi:hypothetical protein